MLEPLWLRRLEGKVGDMECALEWVGILLGELRFLEVFLDPDAAERMACVVCVDGLLCLVLTPE